MKTVKYTRESNAPTIADNPFTVYAAEESTIKMSGIISIIPTGITIPEDFNLRVVNSLNPNLAVINIHRNKGTIFLILTALKSLDTDIIVKQGEPLATIEVIESPKQEHVRFVEITQDGKRAAICGQAAQIDASVTLDSAST